MADPKYCPVTDQVGTAKDILGQKATGRIMNGSLIARSGDGTTAVISPDLVAVAVIGEQNDIGAAVIGKDSSTMLAIGENPMSAQAKAASVAEKFSQAAKSKDCKFGGP